MAKKLAVAEPNIDTTELKQVAKEVEEAPALLQIWERRLTNPLVYSGPQVELKQKGYELRWINTSQQGRFHVATQQEGWVPVRPDELQGNAEDLGLTDQKDGMVRRGPKGEEILVKMPADVFNRIRVKKSEMVVNQLKRTKENLAKSAANRFGEQAADFVMGKGTETTGGLKGDITGQIGKLEA
jgi:hypothetical protein